MEKEKISQQTLESNLKYAANYLRNKIDAGDYKGYIFPLLFYKRISDVYDEEYQKALDESDGDSEYAKSEVNHKIQIPDGCHWNDLRSVSNNVGQKILKSQRQLEKINPNIFGIFGDVNWGNKERLTDETLVNLLEHFSKFKLSLKYVSDDLMGNAYEFLIKKFANDSGHTAAEFYTNRTVVSLMTKLLEPQSNESVYDPTCGTGGMLLECINFLKKNNKDFRPLKLYGQEKNMITHGICRMNMILHGFENAKILRQDTISNPLFLINDKLQKFDLILANPPYSINIWNQKAWKQDPYGRNIYGTPPQKKADYAFIQHIICSMSNTGRSAILLPHGILSSDIESGIRKKLIEDNKLETIIGLPKDMFYNSPMRACIMIFRVKKEKKRKSKVLFINAEHMFERIDNKNFFTSEHIEKIYDVYKRFENVNGTDLIFPDVISDFSYVTDIDEIRKNNYLLTISLYTKYRVKESKTNANSLINDWKNSKNDFFELNSLILKLLEGDLHN